MFFCSFSPLASGVGSACTSSRGSIGETSRSYCPHNDCCHTHEDQEPAELKKIKKVNERQYNFVTLQISINNKCMWFDRFKVFSVVGCVDVVGNKSLTIISIHRMQKVCANVTVWYLVWSKLKKNIVSSLKCWCHAFYDLLRWQLAQKGHR